MKPISAAGDDGENDELKIVGRNDKLDSDGNK